MLSKVLIDIALKSEQEEDKENNDHNYVKLLTIHSAKGLEFENVFLVAFENGIFPSNGAMYSTIELEEERRLCYVAVTRAKKRLFLTNAKNRYVYGREQTQAVSMFFKEMNKDVITSNKDKVVEVKSYPKPGYETKKIEPVKKEGLKAGDKVKHDKFGEGLVVSVDGILATIAFKVPFGVKKLMKDHPSIVKI